MGPSDPDWKLSTERSSRPGGARVSEYQILVWRETPLVSRTPCYFDSVERILGRRSERNFPLFVSRPPRKVEIGCSILGEGDAPFYFCVRHGGDVFCRDYGGSS